MTRIARFALVALVLAGANSAASASGAFEIEVNDKSARVGVTSRLAASGMDVDFGLLHHSDRGEAYQAGLHYAGFAGTAGQVFEVRIGGRVMVLDTDAGDGGCVAIGGGIRYRLPNRERFWLSADARIAPSVLAFGNAKEVYSVGVGAEYRVLERAAIQLRLSQLRAEFDNGRSATLDRGLHIGFRIEF